MTGNLYIDGHDVYSAFGVFANGGYGELVSYPPLKPVDFNDWAEEDGVEADLSAPVLDTRELTIRFGRHKREWHCGGFEAFVRLLSGGAYHNFYFTDIGKTYRLRLVSQNDLSVAGRLSVFSLRFADDFPLAGYSYGEPLSAAVPACGYRLDGRDLSAYGIYVLKGCKTEIQKLPAPKKNLLQNIRSQSGAVYDGGTVTFQSKDVRLGCLMRAEYIEELWHNYHALLYDLVRPGERMLCVGAASRSYPCYYKNSAVSAFRPSGKIWLHFTLNLLFI